MAGKKTHYRKTKSPFKNPFTGIQTRNKAQAFINRTRSGRSRPDPVARCLIISSTKPKSFDFQHVKDLRSKRIFTPPADLIPIPIENAEGKYESKSLESVDPIPIENAEGKYESKSLESVELLDNNKESDIRVSKNEQVSGNGVNFSTKTVVNLGKRRKIFSSPSSFSFKRMLPYLMETENDDSSGTKLEIHGVELSRKMQKRGVLNPEAHSIPKDVHISELDQQIISKVTCNEHEIGQTTPPNIALFSKMEVVRGGETSEVDHELTMNQIHDGFVRNDVRKFGSLKENQRSANLAVLKPCPRLRVFKNPTSVSYKRLLPFLINMSKENTSVSSRNQHQTTLLDSQDGTHPLSLSTAEQTTVKETIEENCEKHLANRGSDSNPDSHYPVECANKSSNTEPSSSTLESAHTLDNSLKPGLEIPQIEISNLKELPVESVSAEHFVNEHVSTTKLMEHDDVVEISNKNDENNFDKSSIKPEVSGSTITPKDRTLKGILKRNPRGCRGPCNCLNCASFRLHADRAYEFSRNQLHDAEEIASDLMKELTMLRLMLEKADAHENNVDIVQISTVQVKEACKKVQETENIAKARLDQLNYDLNVHCRLPGLLPPQVMFASSSVQANLRLNGEK